MENFVINTAIPFAYYLTWIVGGLLLLSMFGGVIMDMIQDYKKALPMVIGIILLLVIFFIVYSSQGGEIPVNVSQAKIAKDGLTSGIMKFVGAGIVLSVALVIGAFIFMLLDMVISFFK